MDQQNEQDDPPPTALGRFVLWCVAILLVLLSLLLGALLAGLMVTNFSENGGQRAMGLEEYLMFAFPVAILVAPLVARPVLRNLGALMGPVIVAVVGLVITTARRGEMTEGIMMLGQIIGFWVIVAWIFYGTVQRLRSGTRTPLAE